MFYQPSEILRVLTFGLLAICFGVCSLANEFSQPEIYRVRHERIGELEPRIRAKYAEAAVFSLVVKPDSEPGVARLAVLTTPEFHNDLVAFLQQNQAVLLPKQTDTTSTSYQSYRQDQPQQYRSVYQSTYQSAYSGSEPSTTLQAGFVSPNIQSQATASKIHAPQYIITAEDREVYSQRQASNGSEFSQETVTPVELQPRWVTPAHLEQMLVRLLGTRLAMISPEKYLVSLDGKEGRKHCSIDIDRMRNRLSLAGDSEPMNQLLQLIRSIDQSKPPEGYQRQFLSLSGVKTESVAMILEARRTAQSGVSPVGFGSRSSGANDLGSGTLFRRPTALKPGSDTSPGTKPGDASPRIEFRNIEKLPAPQPLLKDTDTALNRTATKHLSPLRNPVVRLVGYQFQGDGFDLGNSGGGVDAIPQQGDMMPGEPGMEVVSDFRYQILPDLDVLIIDATGAEVARFTDMIRQIEELSKIADPKIEIFPLKHVNCISLNWVIFQVYNDLFQTKQGAVKIIPLIHPNAMLLIGWGNALESMKDLIETLDKPIAGANNMLQVIRLKHASAQYVLSVLHGAFPRPPMQNSGFAPRVEMFAETRTNAIIVQAGPNDMKEIERIVKEIDVVEAAVKLQLKQFKLKHTMAADLAQVLTSAITPGTSGTSDRKLPSLEMLVMGKEGQKPLDSGIMADVRVSSDVRTNTVIVTAPEHAMPLIEELVKMLDVPAATAEVKVFQILYGDANSLVQTLRSLIPTQLDGQIGPQLPGAKDEESLVPVRFAVDSRTNSILAAGAPNDLKIIEALLYSIDRENSQSRRQTVYPLKSMMAKDVTTAINEYLRSKRLIQKESPGVISPYRQIESEVIIVPEHVSNSLIISATPRYYDEVIQLIREIDQSPPQVVIQVLIGEVTLSNADELGFEFGIQDSLLFNRSTFDNIVQATRTITKTDNGVTTVIEEPFILNGNANPGWLFNENTSGSLGNGYNSTSASQAGNVGSQLLTNFATGRVGAETGFGGMVFSANSDAISIMIRALQETRRLEVLSRPQIMAMNNQPAMIHVGQKVPRVQGTTSNSYQEKTEIQDEDVGLLLQVTPQISPEGNVVMEVMSIKSKVNSNDGQVVGFFDGQPISSPAIDMISTRTMISAADNETVILGGLISKETERIHRKVPLLGDIPVLGKLFSYEYNKCKRSELLVILTPRIVRNGCDAEEIKRIETARMNWCLCSVADLHGDIGAYNCLAETPYAGDATVLTPEAVDMDSLRPLGGEEEGIVVDDRPFNETDKKTMSAGPQLAPSIQNDNERETKKNKLPIPLLPKTSKGKD